MHAARIVVVEDETPIRRGVADTLRASGYTIVEAADGAQGLTEAIRPGVDLVLLDLLLPRRDGLEVLYDLRRVRPTLPVIILTARGTERRLRVVRRNAQGVPEKVSTDLNDPVQPDDVIYVNESIF